VVTLSVLSRSRSAAIIDCGSIGHWRSTSRQVRLAHSSAAGEP